MAQTQVDVGEQTGPTKRASGSWIFKLSLAYLGVNITWAGPGQVLMAPQIQWLTENTPLAFFTESKETNLAIISFVAGVFALISTPLWGALSDRTSSRWGKRTPWITVGTILVSITLVTTGFAWSLPALLISWVAMQTAINAIISPLSAAMPDHVPVNQRGLVSGWWGFTYTLAVVLGTAIGTITTAVWPTMTGITMGYIFCAVACVLSVIPFITDRWERGAKPEEHAPFDWKALAACYYIDVRKNRDFGWAWLSRFLVTLCSAIALFYLYFYLQDHIGLVPDGGTGTGLRVADGVLILTAVYALSVFLTVVTAGGWSDRVGRRRIFVAVAAVLYVCACVLMAFASSFPITIVAALILGLGTGVFTSVDFALVTEVLPSSADSGKDLGIIHLAIGLPNVLAPVVAAFAVQTLGGYTALYMVAAGLAVVGAILVYRIKSVR